MTEFTLPSTVH